jgi:hypothetical protein
MGSSGLAANIIGSIVLRRDDRCVHNIRRTSVLRAREAYEQLSQAPARFQSEVGGVGC